jgi:SOS-response transcriptional repressor LexA
MDFMEDVIGGLNMKDKLTQKQKNLLEIITIYIDDNKIAPTNRELMHLFELKSTSTMHGYLGRLRNKGYIIWEEGKSRTIQILKRA